MIAVSRLARILATRVALVLRQAQDEVQVSLLILNLSKDRRQAQRPPNKTAGADFSTPAALQNLKWLRPPSGSRPWRHAHPAGCRTRRAGLRSANACRQLQRQWRVRTRPCRRLPAR